MTLLKIHKRLEEYLETVQSVEIPNVYRLSQAFGEKMMGRMVYDEDANLNSNLDYFCKCLTHKDKTKFTQHYIGKLRPGYQAQDILYNIEVEERGLCVKGECNKYPSFGEPVRNMFGISDFVLDVVTVDVNGSRLKYLLEVNEIQLSTIDDEELKFIFQMIL